MTITASYTDATNKTVAASVNGSVYSIPSDAIVLMDGRVPGELVAWLKVGNIISPYAPPAFNPATYAAAKAESMVSAVGTYTISGTAIQCDCDQGTIADLLALKSWGSANPTVTSRFVQNNGAVVLLTGNQYVALAVLVGPIRLAIFNTLGTVIQGIMGGTITTQAQVDAAAWPALSGTA